LHNTNHVYTHTHTHTHTHYVILYNNNTIFDTRILVLKTDE